MKHNLHKDWKPWTKRHILLLDSKKEHNSVFNIEHLNCFFLHFLNKNQTKHNIYYLVVPSLTYSIQRESKQGIQEKNYCFLNCFVNLTFYIQIFHTKFILISSRTVATTQFKLKVLLAWIEKKITTLQCQYWFLKLKILYFGITSILSLHIFWLLHDNHEKQTYICRFWMEGQNWWFSTMESTLSEFVGCCRSKTCPTSITDTVRSDRATVTRY